ncbi:uncharacterized protein CTRU02_203187 [Colletotrichum truncatum]|uniref:Uncharacterized protein n=21 Tax=Colletotrichum truncatum TaxID=5467 RepID=A0ACC3YX61_COLTU|nr:uncharacterized protein CTRU02_15457 [Colletotrichum truncatum]XP_036575705.1 uncharacterized protein CTRU02_14355 [Colletotrichum truncatum]XP_036576057.1 uncharacterized protein CTRU02_14047 [Colletotrichum truncatum]XP_036576148.1 uncharacterized protein CTRU02_13835 [Colletotrichum truncatum]XP_036576311.1 uncharacterized protein CTRU02_13688 [Colletotrichum truncatum]XP_036577848.1 uncharacterized protein CTRU02_12154 [Colletotrichum truncatum]XP_036578773.1 uncharacterized protein CT
MSPALFFRNNVVLPIILLVCQFSIDSRIFAILFALFTLLCDFLAFFPSSSLTNFTF